MAPRLRPASWPWLLAQEARLLWRSAGGGRVAFLVVFAVLVVVPAHLIGWLLMRRFDLEAMLQARADLAIWVALFLLLFMLSAAVGLAVNVLFTRGDMDLLLSSPVPIGNLYAVRGISVAVAAIGMFALFLLPVANMGAIRGHWRMLAAYPVLAAMGLLCAALGFNATLLLARWLGARRARVVAQVVGALAGAALVLGSQAFNLLPQSTQRAVAMWLKSESAGTWFGAHSVLTWPVRAFFGDAVPALAVIVLGVGAFVLTVRFTQARFVSATQEVMTAGPSRRTAAVRRPFREGLSRIVIAKELALIARDPMLVAKTLLQSLYLVPLLVVLVRRADFAPVLAASLVVMSASLAGTLAWITVSGEEAPDLLEAAPVSRERVRWLKVAAAALPVAAILVPFLAWYAWLSLSMFAFVAVCTAAGVASAGVVQVWTGRPGSGRDLRARQKQSVLMNFVELFSSVGWGAACYAAITSRYWLVAPGIVLGLAAPGIAWLVRRSREQG
ncbi:MAG: hypothetical protein ACXWF0_09440 [Usitatibacter sp.]